LYEGGIRVPMVVRWPGKVKPGSVCDTPLAFWDVMPTVCGMTFADLPKDTDGVSFLPALTGHQQPMHEFLYWEFPGYGGQQTIQMGKWKAVRQKVSAKAMKGTLELFDLEADPGETTDVAAKHPEVLAKLVEAMKREHTPSKDFPQPGLD
jgi:arylsulfatase A